MFGVIYYAGPLALSGPVVYGPFANRDAALAFRNALDFPGNYQIFQVWPPPPYANPSTVTPQPFSAGQFLACLDTVNASSQERFIVYGPFPTFSQAQVFIAGRPWPGGLSVAEVTTPA